MKVYIVYRVDNEEYMQGIVLVFHLEKSAKRFIEGNLNVHLEYTEELVE